MAAGIADRLWNIEDIVTQIEVEEAKAHRTREPYKKASA
jgi:hypothetical protein